LSSSGFATADEITELSQAESASVHWGEDTLRPGEHSMELGFLKDIVDTISTLLFEDSAVGFHVFSDNLFGIDVQEGENESQFSSSDGSFMNWLEGFTARPGTSETGDNVLEEFSNKVLDLLEKLKELSEVKWMSKKSFAFNGLPKLVFPEGTPASIANFHEVLGQVYDSMKPEINQICSDTRDQASESFNQLVSTIRQAMDQGNSSLQQDLKWLIEARLGLVERRSGQSDQSDSVERNRLSEIQNALGLN
ncbi:MAG: hypothetical protein OXU45_05355, partial [Candidatus Melainabacteria bacterium]|nr:hypothetical protein [Candidatus Melainabacteria bacterium]